MQVAEPETLTPPALAKRWRVGTHRVLTWIRSGELPAANLASDLAGRPRYRIRVDDAEDFWRRRMVIPMPKQPKRERTSEEVLDWLGVDL